MIVYDTRSIRAWSLLGTSGTLGTAVLELAESDPDFAIITSDLCFFSGLEKARKKYSDRVMNVGIAEQNMIGIAGGMAKEGMNVWATTYASFATTRALDQVKVNMGYMKLPVKLVGLGAGLSTGILGATHMSIEDIAIMRAIPNITLLSPADCAETMKAIIAAARMKGPVYIRLPSISRVPIVYENDFDYEIGKANILEKHTDSEITIFATGVMVKTACDVSKQLREKGLMCDVIDIHTIKPIDVCAIKEAARKKLVVVLEEHSIIGGLGAAVSEVAVRLDNYPHILSIGISDYYPHAGPYEALVKQCGLATEDIVVKIISEIK